MMIEQKAVPGRIKRFLDRQDKFSLFMLGVYVFAVLCVLGDVFLWRP